MSGTNRSRRNLRWWMGALLLAGGAWGCDRAAPVPAKPTSSAPAGSATSAPATVPSARSAPGTLDLLKHLELPRDQVRGDFRLVNGALVIPAMAAAHLELPVETPAAYRLELEVERLAGSGSLNIGLIVGERRVMLVLEGWGGTLSALNLVDGQSGDSNVTTYRRPIFTAGRPVSVECTVDAGEIVVRCDDQTVINWKGQSSRLSLDERYFQPRTPNRIIIGGWNSEFRVTQLKLASLSGETIVVPSPVVSSPVVSSTAASEPPASSRPVPVAQNDWPLYEARAYGFSIRMPKTPKQQEIEGGTQFQVETGLGAYFVTASEPDRAGMTPQAYLNQVQAGMFDSGEQILRQRFFTFAGADAAKEVAALDAENDVFAVRFILSPSRLYQVLFVGPKDRLDAPETKRFLESFQFVKP